MSDLEVKFVQTTPVIDIAIGNHSVRLRIEDAKELKQKLDAALTEAAKLRD